MRMLKYILTGLILVEWHKRQQPVMNLPKYVEKPPQILALDTSGHQLQRETEYAHGKDYGSTLVPRRTKVQKLTYNDRRNIVKRWMIDCIDRSSASRYFSHYDQML